MSGNSNELPLDEGKWSQYIDSLDKISQRIASAIELSAFDEANQLIEQRLVLLSKLLELSKEHQIPSELQRLSKKLLTQEQSLISIVELEKKSVEQKLVMFVASAKANIQYKKNRV